MLQDLIKYGGRSEVDKVTIERKARIPRHPVYIVVFAFCEKTKNPDSVWKSGILLSFFSSKWCHQESNRGHKDFQSFALPTELWHHCFLFAVAKIDKVF